LSSPNDSEGVSKPPISKINLVTKILSAIVGLDMGFAHSTNGAGKKGNKL